MDVRWWARWGRGMAWGAGLAVCAASGACTLLIEVDQIQCTSDAECLDGGLGGRCSEGVCVGDAVTTDLSPASCDGGPDCGDVAAPPAASTCGERDCEAAERCFEDLCIDAEVYAQLVCTQDEPIAEPMESASVFFQLHVQEFVSEEPPDNLRVLACRTNDVMCQSAVASFEDTDGRGNVILVLPRAFQGFLELTGDNMLTSLWYLTQPVMRDTIAKDLLVVAPTTLTGLASITGYTVDMSKGLVILEAFDCQERALGGVHFGEGKGTAQPFYIVDQTPNVDVNASVRDDVNDIAIGGFLNAETGFAEFTARLGVDGPLLGRFNARVRANTVTYLDIHRPRL